MRRLHLLVAVLLMAATLAVFWDVRSHQFVLWDDGDLIYRNPYINPVTRAHLEYVWRHPYAKLYMPMTYSVLALVAQNARLATPYRPPGGTPATLTAQPFHDANLLLHILNTLLIFTLLILLLRHQNTGGKHANEKDQAASDKAFDDEAPIDQEAPIAATRDTKQEIKIAAPKAARVAACGTATLAKPKVAADAVMNSSGAGANPSNAMDEARLVWAAGAGAMLFAVHPLQVESVVWGAEMKGLLCAFFSLLALWRFAVFLSPSRAANYERSRKIGKTASGTTRRRLCFSCWRCCRSLRLWRCRWSRGRLLSGGCGDRRG